MNEKQMRKEIEKDCIESIKKGLREGYYKKKKSKSTSKYR